MSDEQSGVFKALAHPTRRQILSELRAGDLAAGEITARFAISGPTISRHLSVLKAAGLVSERRDANRIIYSLNPERLAVTIGNYLGSVCPGQIVIRHHRGRASEKKTA